MKNKILLLISVVTLGFTAATMAQVPNYVPTNGIIGYWPFNGNANDESGNSLNGTVNGATLTSDRFGNANKAYNFDVNQNVVINNTTTLNPFPLTISLWYKATNWSSGENSNIIKKYSSAAWNGFGISFNDYNNLPCVPSFFLRSTANRVIGYYNEPPFDQTNITLSQWYHYVFVIDSIGGKIYVDGSLISTHPWTGAYGPTSSNLQLQIGGLADTWYRGLIDDIGIWNRALSQQEITNLYNGVICGNNTNISPQNNSLATGSIATFNATTSDPNPIYVWQSNFGQGFQTLNNIGNYSGTNTNILSIANVQLAQHNLPIRVITTSGSCVDTSNVAKISITDTCINTINDTNYISVTDTLIINTNVTGINPPNNINTIKIFPNPASTYITIDYGNYTMMNGYQLIIINSLGQQKFQTTINQQSSYINIASWSGSLYFVHIIDPQGNILDIRKIILQ